MTDHIKCSACKKFISYLDLHEGRASHCMLTPDSDHSTEEWESLCPTHFQEKKNEQFLNHCRTASKIVSEWPAWKRNIIR